MQYGLVNGTIQRTKKSSSPLKETIIGQFVPGCVENCEGKAGPEQIPDGEEGKRPMRVGSDEEAVLADGDEKEQVGHHDDNASDAWRRHI